MLSVTCFVQRQTISFAGHGQRERPTTGSCYRLSDEQNIKILGTIMKVKYDQEVDILRICFSSAAVDESDEQKPGIILDYDKNGDIVGIEILNASKRMEIRVQWSMRLRKSSCFKEDGGPKPAARVVAPTTVAP